MKSRSFKYIAQPDARVLILGSLPGQVSLERQQYYAQPYNAFWRIMGEIAGAFPDLPYQDRLRRLKQNHIAVWDVCAAGHRPGSLDSSIDLSSVEPNNISGFLRDHQHVRLICFNGQKAKDIFRRKVKQEPRSLFERVRYEQLPSTSAAHAGMAFERKLFLWRTAIASRHAAAEYDRTVLEPVAQGSLT